MSMLLGAVLIASLFGSAHCVGMCGPLALWASGASERRSRGQVLASTTAYHAGRGVSYVAVGLVAGAIGGALDAGGEMLGVQVAAARVAGTVMVVLGVVRLWRTAGPRWFRHPGNATAGPSRVGMLLVRLRPFLFGLSPMARSFAGGTLTALLPCGWLYLFAIVAAGSGSPVNGGLVMAAFWWGTVPALSALVAGARILSHRFAAAMPVVAAGLMIVAGGFTATGRGLADASRWGLMIPTASSSSDDLASGGSIAAEAPAELIDRVRRAGATPLPCCQIGGRESATAPASANEHHEEDLGSEVANP